MADEEAKEDVNDEPIIDPDEESVPVEEEAAAPAGPAPIIKKKKLDADHAGHSFARDHSPRYRSTEKHHHPNLTIEAQPVPALIA